MTSVTSGGRPRRRKVAVIKEALRELNNQLSLFSYQVSAKVALKPVDFDCLELLNLHGPLSPSALAKHAGLHPATMTGVLDRLQRAGWITRDRPADAADRRAVVVSATGDRDGEVYRHLAGMNSRVDDLCAGYTEAELDLITDFLRRTTEAGKGAAGDLAGESG
ncbi:MarR family winged helix-turn-helix transcriptional regulator [Amycolatopsis umgeniensis]|uniref:DNA-binding MarR family transcriptional regulator n=1 Tax=Amycolatopsis umgeniensis TaxID=336628 RepID=A0A841AZT8_9PSEU|nr:MarR family transcriptional regulator [Amycolatopsis umgeniensis]MBB5851784.1 DNA-binding MarR family transcriptional regulator [Amycolatopsis umgeniensis]